MYIIQPCAMHRLTEAIVSMSVVAFYIGLHLAFECVAYMYRIWTLVSSAQERRPTIKYSMYKYISYFVAAFISVCATLCSVSFILCYPLLLLLHVRQFVILFRSYLVFFSYSIFSFTSCSVSVLATCSLLLYLVYATAAVRPDDCACADALLPSPRYFHFCFSFGSCRLLDSVLFVYALSRSLNATLRIIHPLDGKSAMHT